MSTKIFYNDNRIIIDGHADTPTECQAITAMCDSMANSENFKTIVYERGHAVFERVSGGDTLMFNIPPAQFEVLKQQVQGLMERVSVLENGGGDLSLYLSKNEAELTYEKKSAHENSIAIQQGYIDTINATLGYVDTSYGTVADQINECRSTDILLQQLGEKALEEALIAKSTANAAATSAELDALETRVTTLEESAGDSEALTALETRVDTLASMVSTVGNKTEYTLPYTADELIAKLESI